MRILGQKGSTACIVIAALVVEKALSGKLPISTCSKPTKEFQLAFATAMVEGNALCDGVSNMGLLAIYHVLDLWAELGLQPAR